VIFLQISLSIFANLITDRDYSKGPLYGKNMYLLFSIYYNFPGLRASCGKEFEFEYHVSTYYTQDFSAYQVREYIYKNEGRYYDKRDIARDYEGLTGEIGASFYFLKNLQAGFEMRIVSYYGGFMDRIVEAFHNAFFFPNAGREYFLQDQVFVNLPNANKIKFYLDKPSVGFGDIDMWIKYNFYQSKKVAIACFGAFKIPSGNMAALSGSGYPDIGTGLLFDFKPFWLFSIYLQGGIVLPFDLMLPVPSKPMPMFNGLIGLELNPLRWFSLLAQVNIKTSPITKSLLLNSWDTRIDALVLPQLNTLVGVKFSWNNFNFQFYFEEDSFTNQGTDWTVNLMFSQKIRFFK
jgi:hypothetical protein